MEISNEEILNCITRIKNELSMLEKKVKLLEKERKKEKKNLEKQLIKKGKNRSKIKSGFACPSKVSEKLCKFMDKPKGTEIARTEVTQYIIKYIKDNKLQKQENKKEIKVDKKLKELLEITENEKLNFFNLQSYMNKHFVK